MKTLALLFGIGAGLASTAAMAAPSVALLKAMEFTGRGTQIYSCQEVGSAYSWVLNGPDAHMYDAEGKAVARHFFGPSWQANDGSLIKGVLLVASASPLAGKDNVPWLVLSAVVEQGQAFSIMSPW